MARVININKSRELPKDQILADTIAGIAFGSMGITKPSEMLTLVGKATVRIIYNTAVAAGCDFEEIRKEFIAALQGAEVELNEN